LDVDDDANRNNANRNNNVPTQFLRSDDIPAAKPFLSFHCDDAGDIVSALAIIPYYQRAVVCRVSIVCCLLSAIIIIIIIFWCSVV